MSYKLRVFFACILLGSLLIAGWAPTVLANDGGTHAAPFFEQLAAWASDVWERLTGGSVELDEASPDPDGEPGPGIGGYIDPRG